MVYGWLRIVSKLLGYICKANGTHGYSVHRLGQVDVNLTQLYLCLFTCHCLTLHTQRLALEGLKDCKDDS